MIFNKLTLVALAALVALGEANVLKLELREGGFIELDVKEDKSVAYTQQQAKVFSALAHKTKDIVTEYLARVTSDQFTNTIAARNNERVALIRKFQDLIDEFGDKIDAVDASEKQLARLTHGLRLIGILLADFGEVDQYRNVRFSVAEFDYRAEVLVQSVFDGLPGDQVLASADVRMNGRRVDDMIVEYNRLLRSEGLNDMVYVLKNNLLGLANWLAGEPVKSSD